MTLGERQHQRTLLELLVSTGEQYRQENECDRELFQVIALDAKGVAQSRITAAHAARLLEEASTLAESASPAAKASERQQASAESATDVDADEQQPNAVRH